MLLVAVCMEGYIGVEQYVVVGLVSERGTRGGVAMTNNALFRHD